MDAARVDNPFCLWSQCIDPLANPIVIGMQDNSGWVSYERAYQRMRSIGELLKEIGVDIYATVPGDEPVDEPVEQPPKRDELWGFAVGDRVRFHRKNATHGLIGKVTWIGGCSIAKMSENCRDVCPNVGVCVTHRILPDGDITPTVVGQMTCPPADLEHID